MTGHDKLDRILLGVSILCSLLTLGFFLYNQQYARPLPDDEKAKEELFKDASRVSYPKDYRLKRMIINLRSRNTRLRYLDVRIHLVPFTNETHRLFGMFEFKIYDGVNDIVGKMTPEELNSIHGKILLEDRLKKRINNIFRKSSVKEIHFSRFTIQ